ncbi:MAG: lipoyl synthase [Bdellovibrionota bacterium]
MKKPVWFKKAPLGREIGSKNFIELKNIIEDRGIFTVCREAKCPNIGECWTHRTATFMILGDTCTRNCAFCSIKKASDGHKLALPSDKEIENISKTIYELNLKHAVITTVTRDDLKDGGAMHFYKLCINIHKLLPSCTIELLISDLHGNIESLKTILSAPISILNHNIETVPSLYKKIRPMASYERSLKILSEAKKISPKIRTKSGMMLGLGETKDEILKTMDDLLNANVDILTLGQYLQPTKNQVPVKEFIPPEQFNEYKKIGLQKGFDIVEASPFTRSSYNARNHV